MAKTGKAQRGSGSEPTGEKHPHTGAVGGQGRGDSVAPCVLCALLRRNGSLAPPRTPSRAAHGLRIAVVTDDAETRLAARRMIEAKRGRLDADSLHPPIVYRLFAMGHAESLPQPTYPSLRPTSS